MFRSSTCFVWFTISRVGDDAMLVMVTIAQLVVVCGTECPHCEMEEVPRQLDILLINQLVGTSRPIELGVNVMVKTRQKGQHALSPID